MNDALRQQLDELALGLSSRQEERALEEQALSDPAVAAAHSEARELAGLLALEPAARAPSAGLRRALMAEVAGQSRFERFVHDIARLMDVAAERAGEWLGRLDELSVWEASPWDGVRLYHVSGGPRVSPAITGFVTLAPGASFPEHQHHGAETVYILQGRCRDTDGSEAGPGDVVERPPGSTHGFTVLEPGPPLVYLAIVFEGLTVGALELKPGDPAI